MPAEHVHALVERTQRPLDAQTTQERDEPAKRPARAVREEQDPEDDRAEDERALDPQIGADVVPTDGERETDRRKDESRNPAERAFEQDDRRQVAEPARMAARALVDA